MELAVLTALILVLNAAIDTGDYQDVSIAEVEEHIEKGDLISYLRNRLKGDASWLDLYDAKTCEEVNEKMKYVLAGYKGRERRKLGIEKSGLCLLIAFTLDIIIEDRK